MEKYVVVLLANLLKTFVTVTKKAKPGPYVAKSKN